MDRGNNNTTVPARQGQGDQARLDGLGCQARGLEAILRPHKIDTEGALSKVKSSGRTEDK